MAGPKEGYREGCNSPATLDAQHKFTCPRRSAPKRRYMKPVFAAVAFACACVSTSASAVGGFPDARAQVRHVTHDCAKRTLAAQ